jgi:3-oxoacyl-[acyl-carrier protein] reductase
MPPNSTASRELDGQVAIVTGSALNTGSTIAKILARVGAAVVINYRSSEAAAEETVKEIEAAGGQVFSYRADVTDPAQVEAMIAATVDRFGGIDILVNNANVRSYNPLLEITLEEWQATLNTTLNGPFHCVRSCVPHMIKRGKGTIVNIGGGSGHEGVANRCHVATAKAGLAGMTGALATELAPHNISVNCIVPGRVDTNKPASKTANRAHRSEIPMGRPAAREEIADLVRYLCGDGCRYMSGQMLHVNGARYITIA